MIKYLVMINGPEGNNSALYPPVEQVMGFGDWAATIDSRVSRIQQFVIPTLSRDITGDYNPQRRKFLKTAIEELSRICMTKFTGEGRFPSEIPVYCLLDENAQQAPSYNLNGNRGTHNESTIHAAQKVVDAICPELGIDITDDRASLMKKTDQAKVLGFAKYSSLGGTYYAAHCGTIFPEFSTILPGVTLSIVCGNDRKYISLDWNVM